MIFPFDDVVVKALAGVIRSAAIGVYKFDEFISDVKDIIESDDVQGLLPSLKYLYLKETARQLVKNPTVAGNFTSSEEVLSYQAHVEPELE